MHVIVIRNPYKIIRIFCVYFAWQFYKQHLFKHEIHHQSEKRTEPKKEQKGQTKLRLFLGVALASNIYVCLMTIFCMCELGVFKWEKNVEGSWKRNSKWENEVTENNFWIYHRMNMNFFFSILQTFCSFIRVGGGVHRGTTE